MSVCVLRQTLPQRCCLSNPLLVDTSNLAVSSRECVHMMGFSSGESCFSLAKSFFSSSVHMNTCIYVYIHRGLQHTCIIGHMYFYWPSLTIWISHLSQLKTNSNFNSENKSLTLEVKFLFQSALSTVECTRTHTHTCARVRAFGDFRQEKFSQTCWAFLLIDIQKWLFAENHLTKSGEF